MKGKLIKVFSHLTLVLLGFVLVKLWITPQEAEEGSEEVSVRARSKYSQGMNSYSSGQKRGAVRVSASPSAFQGAWDSFPDQGLMRSERILAQRRFLKEWAKVDLRAAMEAVLGESWKNEEGFNGPGANEGSLAPALAEAFAEDSEGSWGLIQSGEFGMGAGMFRKVWFRAVGQSNPEELARVVGDVSGYERGSFFTALTNGVGNEELLKENVVAALMRQTEESITARELVDFIDAEVTYEELVLQLEGADWSSREGEIMRLQFSDVAQVALAQTKDGAEAQANLMESLQRLPKEQRGEFLFEIAKDYSFRKEGVEGERKMLGLFDGLIAEADWENLGSQEVKNQLERMRALPELEFAEWAVNLPQREEVESLFHTGIEKYVRNNMEESWEWIQNFPDDTWQEQALVVYSWQAANVHRDWDESWRAIESIQDPRLRKNARNWRPLWMKQKDVEEGRR